MDSNAEPPDPASQSPAEDLSSSSVQAKDFAVKHFLVKGRVQGVGFRWFVHREAAELGLRGWVRNTNSGEVELVAAGPAEAVADLASALRQGSRGSRVDSVLQHDLHDAEADTLGPFVIEGAW